MGVLFEVRGGVNLRHSGWGYVLAAALLLAAQAAYAQPQAQEKPPSAEPTESLPERFFGGLRDILRSIFAPAETSLPAPQETPQAQPASQPASQPATPQAAPQAAREEPNPAITATPNASAVPLSLHSAIAKGDYANALKMIEQGTDIESKDPGAGASALHYAVMKGEMPLVGLLVQRGADVNSRTKSGTTPLHTAVLYGRFEVAEYLLDKGSEVNAKSASGATPMSLATAAGYARIAKMLRARGAN